MMETWDYCLRKMFVTKGTPISKAISGLGPGAESLVKVLTDPNLPPNERVDVSLRVRDLSVADWALIVRAFDAWPFKPDVRRRAVYLRVWAAC